MIYCTKLLEGGLGGNRGPRKRPGDLGLGYCRLTWMEECKVYDNMFVCGRKRRLCIKPRKRLGIVEQGSRDQKCL